ncbi:lysophospholipid acyltransferase family protein [Shimia ponticola]|uniref:lysophospholipid acyltransferase family protein n=1 Tax=Shimia ponticola TaxID=2582893 RepID=UPI0011BFC938|nr:lysophospholipid acyltransferase family protein [Shimia ponticola]
MTTSWDGAEYPENVARTPRAWWRALRRGLPLAIVTFGCLGLLLLLRLVERPLFGMDRPITPHITQFVCRSAFRLMGMQLVVEGTPMVEKGAAVANHSSWLDIFALNAPQRVYFVSKSEVAGWPGIGWLARATGTLFIERKRSQALAHGRMFRDRLLAGHHLMFFPEGTSTDGRRVLPFKPTLFAPFQEDGLRDTLHIQPISLVYTAPEGAPDRFYGWWGDMDFGNGLLNVLMVRNPGGVTVIFHEPLRVADYPDRKSLAKALEEVVRSRVPQPCDT